MVRSIIIYLNLLLDAENEVYKIRQATSNIGYFKLKGLTMFVNL